MPPRPWTFVAVLLCSVALAFPALAAVTATPSTVAALPTQTTSPITLTLTFGPANAAGTGTLSAAGLPAGVTTQPSPISYTFQQGDTSATTSFQFALDASAVPGTYSISLRDGTMGAGLATVTLVVQQPSFTATASPNPVSVPIGGSSNVTVTTNPDPGFNERVVNYSFSGFPNFIGTGSAQQTGAPTYPPLTFVFSVASGATPGTYSGLLNAALATGATKTFPFAVVVQQPDIAASFTQPSLILCNNGTPSSDAVSLNPVNGYSGTPILTFTSVPPGVTITPSTLSPNRMPPGQTIPFEVSAAGAATGGQSITLNIYDDVAGISKNITLLVNVVNPDFTAAVAPSTVSLNAGGGSQTFTASIAPNNCFNAPTVTVTATGQPSGLTITPSQATITGPGYAPASFLASAASSLTPGAYPVTLTFTPSSGGPTRQATVTINVGAALDFTLSATPAALTIRPGETSTLTITATGVNGFKGAVNVSSPVLPDVSFSPATFTVPAGGSQTVAVTASPSATPRTITILFTGSAAGVTGTRAAPVSLTIAPGPDFVLHVSPSATTVVPGQSTTVTVSVEPLNGFNGVVSVTAPPVADLTLTPPVFELTSGTTQTVTIAASIAATPRTETTLFSATSPGVQGTHTAPLTITIAPRPDFSLAVMPSALTIVAGGSGNVTVSTATINGFNGSVQVSAVAPAGATVSPATFTLAVGASQNVTISVDPNAPAGTVTIQFNAAAPSIGASHSATAVVTISPRPDFSVVVTPASLTIPALGSASAVVSILAINGFSGSVTVAAPSVAGIAFTPSTFQIAAGSSQSVTLTSTSAVPPPAPIPLTFTATDPSSGLTHTATLLLGIAAPLPQITAVTVPSTVAGTRASVFRLTGMYFQQGASVRASSPFITIENVSVLSPTMADLTLSVRSDAPAGPYILMLTNPDGGTTPSGGTLLVYPPSSLGAPLGVTAAAIIFPPQGTIIAGGSAVYPRGLLATTGTGTIVGTWNFDGVPFDRFIVTVTGGMPAEVRTHVPVPISFNGGHNLELVIETPRHAVSPSVEIVEAVDSVSRLTIFGPADGGIVGPDRPATFRWSLVPGASGYAIEFAPGIGTPGAPDNPLQLKRIRTSDSEWVASRRELDSLGIGAQRWRVRAIFPGEAEGEPTEWRRLVLLPATLTLVVQPPVVVAGGRTSVRWSGGIAGVLYRVEFLAPGGKVLFSALTSRPEYTLPPSADPLPEGFTVRVTALGPGGIVLGTSAQPASPGSSRANSKPHVMLAQQSSATVTSTEPANGGSVTTSQPVIGAAWSGSVPTDQVSMVIDSTDVTAVATITASSIRYETLLPLENGQHTARLALGTALTTWTFNVQTTAAEATPEAAAAGTTPGETPPPAAPTTSWNRDWAVTPMGTLTAIHSDVPGTVDELRAQVSALTDLSNGKTSAKVTGDISVKHEFDDPNRTVQESRNWLTQFGATTGSIQEQAIIGFAPPDFVDQSELLSTGVARGGAEGKIIAPYGTAAYFETTGFRPVGVVAGNFGPDQKVRAFALRAPTNDRWDVRAIGMSTTDEPGFNSAGGEGDAWGFFASFAVSPTLRLLGEGARGGFTPNDGSAEEEREGNAFRFGLIGSAGTLTYGVNLRRTDADYVNPANRGFTAGSVPDRMGGDLMLAKTFGMTSVSVQVRHLQDGNSSGALIPTTNENGGVISVMTMLGSRVSMVATGNLTTDKGDAVPELYLPRTDRRQAGGALTFSEMLGRFALSQTYTRQELADDVSPDSNQTIQSAMVTAGGAVTANFNLMGVVSATRGEGSALIGTTDQLLVSVQPSIAIPSIAISFQPRAQYSRSKNDVSAFESTSEQYQGIVSWNPSWLASLFGLQLTADFSRNEYTGQVGNAHFVRQYIGSLSVHWGAGNGAATPMTPLPGVAPVSAPADANTPPVATPAIAPAVSQ